MKGTVYAMGYARVSAAKQAVEGDSLPVQAALIAKAIRAAGHSLFPSEVIQEPFTGTTNDRPAYRKAIATIKGNPGKIKYFYIRTIDRFTREGSFEYQHMKRELAELGVTLRDIGGVIQEPVNALEHLGVSYKWSRVTPSAISEVVLAEAGNQEVSKMLVNMIGAEIALTRLGYHIGPADDGYVVKRTPVEDKKRCIQVPDPERGTFLRTMFEMRAGGLHSDKEIVAHVNALGFRTRVHHRWNREGTAIVGRTVPKPLTVKRFQEIIRRPIYCGVVLRKWTNRQPIRAKGEPLVSIETYNRANRGQRVIEETSDGTLRMQYSWSPDLAKRKRSSFSHRWPHKNVVVCPYCRRPLWASASRGKSGQRFSSYHCARGHRRYAVRQRDLDASFGAYLDSLRFAEPFWSRFTVLVRDVFGRALEDSQRKTIDTAESVQELKERKESIAEAFTVATSESMRAMLEAKLHDLDVQIATLQEVRQDLDIASDDVDEFLDYVRKTLEHPKRILDFIENKTEQLALYSLFLEEFPTYEEIRSGTPKLRPTFRVFQSFANAESATVHRHGLNWNNISEDLIRWRQSYWAIDLVYERMKLAEGSSSKAA